MTKWSILSMYDFCTLCYLTRRWKKICKPIWPIHQCTAKWETACIWYLILLIAYVNCIISSFQEWANAMARRPSSVCPSICKLLHKSLLLAGKWPDRYQTFRRWTPGQHASRMCSRSKVTWYGHFCAGRKIASSPRQMARSPPNLHMMVIRWTCIQGVLKVKVKGHVIRALSWILGMSYSVIDGLVVKYFCFLRFVGNRSHMTSLTDRDVINDAANCYL